MNHEPKFCPRCGSSLMERRGLAVDSWEKYVWCPNGHKYKIIYHDMMGGADYCAFVELEDA